MRSFKHDQRFANSTRGRIVALLRGSTKTVNELAGSLALTDNAVRVHLSSLERDGIVQPAGPKPGFRKPHQTYALTDEAEQSFARAYEPVLKVLIDVLESKLPATQMEDLMREVGEKLASANPDLKKGTVDERMDRAIKLINSLGGETRTEVKGNELTVYGLGCPLRSVVAGHPEACTILETLLTELIGVKVTQKCEHSPSPRCCFNVRLEMA